MLIFHNLPGSIRALGLFPIFSVLLSVLLMVGAKRLRQQHKIWLLTGCYYVLILSTISAIPDLANAYRYTLEQYTQYQSQSLTKTGILGLIDAFAYTEKPFLPGYILKGLILIGYAGWSAWQIMLLNKLRKNQ